LEMYIFEGIIQGNLKMSLCFTIVGALLATTSPVEASPVDVAKEPAVTTVVKADPKSGRLVRRVAVNPRALQNGSLVPRAAAEPSGGRAVVAGNGLDTTIDEAARRHGIDPLLVHAVVHVESRYNRLALSPKGAEGLMQLIPSTARRFGVKNSFSSHENIEGGVKYLRFLQERFQDLPRVLAAYNAGENAVERYNGIPPYPETQNYVYLVGRRYQELRRQNAVPSIAVKRPVETNVEAEEFRPVEAYLDEDGRLHLRTR
jgi:soluble lytic murein transglycosylase-like protein